MIENYHFSLLLLTLLEALSLHLESGAQMNVPTHWKVLITVGANRILTSSLREVQSSTLVATNPSDHQLLNEL